MNFPTAAADDDPAEGTATSAALRLLTQHHPTLASQQLAHLARTGSGIDLYLLIAEIHQQLHQWPEAHRACRHARMLLIFDDAAGLDHAARVAAVTADIAVCSGRHAVQACAEYRDAAADIQQRDGTKPRTAVIAAALEAVAAYHRDCQTGRQALHDLRPTIDGDPALTDAIDAAITTITVCGTAATPPTEPLPPLPGLFLAPHNTDPAREWLDHRLRLHQPRAHTCTIPGATALQERPR